MPEKHCRRCTENITIPASIFKFANTDIEDNMEAFEDYCTDVRRDGDDTNSGSDADAERRTYRDVRRVH